MHLRSVPKGEPFIPQISVLFAQKKKMFSDDTRVTGTRMGIITSENRWPYSVTFLNPAPLASFSRTLLLLGSARQTTK